VRRPKHPGSTLIRLYVLGAIFLIPLSIGIVMVTNNASRSDHAYQASHDVGSMFAQGLDFSQGANQNIALNVAEGIGIGHPRGQWRSDPQQNSRGSPFGLPANATGKCGNKGYPVVTERYVSETGRCAPAHLERPPVSIRRAAKFAIGPTTYRRAPPTSLLV